MTTGFLPAPPGHPHDDLDGALGRVSDAGHDLGELVQLRRPAPVPSHESLGSSAARRVRAARGSPGESNASTAPGGELALRIGEQRHESLRPAGMADDGQVRGGGLAGGVAEVQSLECLLALIAADAPGVGGGEQPEPATVHLRPCRL